MLSFVRSLLKQQAEVLAIQVVESWGIITYVWTGQELDGDLATAK